MTCSTPERQTDKLKHQVAEELTHAVAAGAVCRRQQEGEEGEAEDKANVEHLDNVHPEKRMILIVTSLFKFKLALPNT